MATVGLRQYPVSLNPITSTDASAVAVEDALFAGLVGLDAGLRWYGDLAEQVPTVANGGVRVVGGGMDVRYRLRSGLRWSDGQPLTADDVLFTWQAIMRGSFGPDAGTAYQDVERVEKQGDREVVVRFRRTFPAYLQLFGAVLPAHRLAALDTRKLAVDPYWQKPDVVSGPFTVKAAVPGDHLSMERNPQFHAGRPRDAVLDQIVFRALAGQEALAAAARAGELDVALDVGPAALGAAVPPGLRIAEIPSLGYEQVTLNRQDPLWSADPRLVEALDAALDRGRRGSRAPAAAGPLAPQVAWAYEDTLKPQAHDLARSRRLLEQDGWRAGADGVRQRGGRRLALTLSTVLGDPEQEQVGEVVAAEWRAIGAEVAVTSFPARELFGPEGPLAHGSFQAAAWEWTLPYDPDSLYDVLHTGGSHNYSRCHDGSIDRALDEGRATLETERRAAAYRQFQRAYRGARCELPLYRRPAVAAASRRLHNLALNPAPVGATWNIGDWWVD